jgi:hypothetical protein
MSWLKDFPGYLGFTSQGVIAIHADWPVYPEEHGSDLALLWLTAFPKGTAFKPASDIDRCILLLADVKCSNRKDPFDERNFHIAIWHEDLFELWRKTFITGVAAVSERRWQELFRATLPVGPLHIKLDDGTLEEIQLPALDDYDEEDISWPEFSHEGIAVTPSGRDHAASLVAAAAGDIGILGERIHRLLASSFFDTAVREACIALEHRIKSWLQSDRWGEALVEEFISRLRSDGKLLESYLRVLRGQIRTAFKFIRNDFMHNFVDIDETQCRALLFRLARVKAELEGVLTRLSSRSSECAEKDG